MGSALSLPRSVEDSLVLLLITSKSTDQIFLQDIPLWHCHEFLSHSVKSQLTSVSLIIFYSVSVWFSKTHHNLFFHVIPGIWFECKSTAFCASFFIHSEIRMSHFICHIISTSSAIYSEITKFTMKSHIMYSSD